MYFLLAIVLIIVLICAFWKQIGFIHDALSGEADDRPPTNKQRQAHMVLAFTEKWKDDKARVARLETPPVLADWLDKKLPAIAKHDPQWFTKQEQPTDQRGERRLIAAAIQRALDVTDYWAGKAKDGEGPADASG